MRLLKIFLIVFVLPVFAQSQPGPDGKISIGGLIKFGLER